MESIRGMADGLPELAMGFGGLLCLCWELAGGWPTSTPYVGWLREGEESESCHSLWRGMGVEVEMEAMVVVMVVMVEVVEVVVEVVVVVVVQLYTEGNFTELAIGH